MPFTTANYGVLTLRERRKYSWIEKEKDILYRNHLPLKKIIGPRLLVSGPHCGRSYPSRSFDKGSPFASPSRLQSPFREGAPKMASWHCIRAHDAMAPTLLLWPLPMFVPQFSSHPAIFLSPIYIIILGSCIYELLFPYTSLHIIA